MCPTLPPWRAAAPIASCDTVSPATPPHGRAALQDDDVAVGDRTRALRLDQLPGGCGRGREAGGQEQKDPRLVHVERAFSPQNAEELGSEPRGLLRVLTHQRRRCG